HLYRFLTLHCYNFMTLADNAFDDALLNGVCGPNGKFYKLNQVCVNSRDQWLRRWDMQAPAPQIEQTVLRVVGEREFREAKYQRRVMYWQTAVQIPLLMAAGGVAHWLTGPLTGLITQTFVRQVTTFGEYMSQGLVNLGAHATNSFLNLIAFTAAHKAMVYANT